MSMTLAQTVVTVLALSYPVYMPLPQNGASFGPNAVVLEAGDTVYRSTKTIPTSVGNPAQAFVSFWYKLPTSANPSQPPVIDIQAQELLTSSDYWNALDIEVGWASTGVGYLYVGGQDGTVLQYAAGFSNCGLGNTCSPWPSIPSDGNWHNVRLSISLPSSLTTCIDTRACTTVNPQLSNNTSGSATAVPLAGNYVVVDSCYFGVNSGTGAACLSPFSASLAEVFLAPGVSPDPSMLSGGVGPKFVQACSSCASGVQAVDLGATGSIPLSTEPLLYMRGSVFLNQATGSVFDVNGTAVENTFPFTVQSGTITADVNDPFLQ